MGISTKVLGRSGMDLAQPVLMRIGLAILQLVLCPACLFGQALERGVFNAATGLHRYAGCELVATTWADGDSFAVRFPDGTQRIIEDRTTFLSSSNTEIDF